MRWAQASLPDRMLDILFNHARFVDLGLLHVNVDKWKLPKVSAIT